MAETLVLKAKRREQAGTRAARRQRREGLVPAIIYGHKEEVVPVLLDYHDLALELQHHHRLLGLELEGNKSQYLVKEVQYDHLGDKIVHVDLTRVYLDERVQVTVAIELRGTAAGVMEGGVLEQQRADVELECLVTNIPESIRVRVNDLVIGQSVLAGDLEIPEGTKLITDPKAVVATVRMKVEEVEEVTETAEEKAEPEMIAREKEEKEGKEEKEEKTKE